MSEWNPELYLKFKAQRTQPAIDLISRIECKKPERILDIGSGPGNSSNELRKRWRHAEIIGIDSSETMIEKARKSYPKISFLLKDAAGNLDDLGRFDIIFSNAAVQWIPGIEKLLPYWFSMLKPGGVLAMQIPNPTTMAIYTAMKETMAKSRWCTKFNGFSEGWYFHEPGGYYDILSGLSLETDVWETHYSHVMPDHEAIIDWWSSAGLRPHFAIMNDDEKHAFTDDILKRIREMYPIQKDRVILFPFRRIFLLIRNCP